MKRRKDAKQEARRICIIFFFVLPRVFCNMQRYLFFFCGIHKIPFKYTVMLDGWQVIFVSNMKSFEKMVHVDPSAQALWSWFEIQVFILTLILFVSLLLSHYFFLPFSCLYNTVISILFLFVSYILFLFFFLMFILILFKQLQTDGLNVENVVSAHQ